MNIMLSDHREAPKTKTHESFVNFLLHQKEEGRDSAVSTERTVSPVVTATPQVPHKFYPTTHYKVL